MSRASLQVILLLLASLVAHAVTDSAATVNNLESKSAQTGTRDMQASAIDYTLLLSAGSLAWSVFRTLFFGMYSIISFILSPVTWILALVWHTLIARPWALFMHVAHVMYPVVIFCLIAVGCGVAIGGCAGFAAEAFSSFVIAATWGKQPSRSRVEYETTPPSPRHHYGDSMSMPPLDDDDLQSLYASSDRFATSDSGASNPFGMSEKQRGKQPAVAVDTWRSNIRGSSASSSYQDLSRASMRMSAMDNQQDDWEWAEEDEEPFPSRRRRSASP